MSRPAFTQVVFVFLGLLWLITDVPAQQAPAEPRALSAAPLAFMVDWVRPKNHEDTSVRYSPV